MINLRLISFKAIAAVVAIVVGGGGAYYYYVYLPQMEAEAIGAAHSSAKPTVGVKPAKPPVVQTPAVSAVPATSQLSASAPVLTPQPVKPVPAERKSARNELRNKARPAQPTMIVTEPAASGESRQMVSPMAVVSPDPGVSAVPAAEPSIVTPKYSDILTAVLRGDKDGVSQLLELGRWVDKPGSSGLTPLMAAVMNRDAQMVQLLLEHGAEPSAQALKLARKYNDAETVLLLERHGVH